MLTSEQLQSLKKTLLTRKEEIEGRVNKEDNELEFEARDNGELSSYDNHPGDQATELHDREVEEALDQQSKEELEEIHEALQAMEDGNYGICEVCGESIPYERLEALPTAKRRIEHADVDLSEEKRFVNEVVGSKKRAKESKDEVIYDREDTWRDVSEHGTSDSPSDLTNPEDGYNPEPKEEESVEEIEGIKVADLEGNDSGRTLDRKEHS